MKVLIVNKFLYPKGGDAVCAIDTGAILERYGHTVIFWGTKHPLNRPYKYDRFFVPYIDLDCRNPFSKKVKAAMNFLYSYEARRGIEAIIQQERPDIAHLHNYAHHLSPSILDVLKKYDVPAVMTLHDFKLVCPCYSLFRSGALCDLCRNRKFYHCMLHRCVKNSFSKSLLTTIEMYLHHRVLKIYEKIDAFISPSRFLKHKMVDMGFSRKIFHLSNFVDPREYHPDYSLRDSSVVYFGRLSKEKGLYTLLKAVRKVKNVLLKVIGDGPEKDHLLRFARRTHIDNVLFLGFKEGPDLRREIARSSFVVLPSECYENSPRSILEAFALGKPAVASRIGGIPELVSDGLTGLTFTPGDENDLGQKIKSIGLRPQRIREMGRNARHFVETSANSETYYHRLASIYAQALAARL